MMRHVLFVHDHKFKLDACGAIYSEGKITDEVLCRYEVLSRRIVVVSRCEHVDSAVGFNEITKENVEFRPVRGLRMGSIFTWGLLFNCVTVSRQVLGARCVVLRLPSFLGVFAALFCEVFRRPYFVEVVGDAFDSIKYSGKSEGFLFTKLANAFDRISAVIVRRSQGAIYVTESYLQTRYPSKGLTSGASNVELDLCALNPYLLRSCRGSKLVVGSIGSYSNTSKGFQVAIAATALLRSSGVDCELRILGSGDSSNYAGLLEELGVSSHVHFDGSLPGGAEVNRWLDDVDIYIQPSLGGEGLPRALIEAMARGIPVVGTRVSGIPEVVPEDFVVTPGSSEELADRIAILHRSKELRRQVGNINYLIAGRFDSAELRRKRSEFWAAANVTLSRRGA